MRPESAGALLVLLLVAGCGGGDGEGDGAVDPSPDTVAARYPAVLEVELAPADDGTYDVDVTISSAYDSAERYADGWRVLDPSGELLGRHALSHNHASEQPFTRTQTGLEVPDGVDTVTVEGHDSDNGYGGQTVDVEVPSG